LNDLLLNVGLLNSDILKEAIKKELAEKSLTEYIKQAWPIIEPGTPFLYNWHIDAISEYLEAVTAGQITRLIINIPPRYMKSIQVSVMWPTWEWIKIPEMRYTFASYSASLSTKHSVDRRTIIRSEWYQRRWGKKDGKPWVTLADDQDTKTEFMNTRRGVMVATSVGGTATGKGGNRIIVDDPHNPEEAQSDAERNRGIRYFDQTLSTRLDDKKKGAIVVVMQRLHEVDLTGHLLKDGGWEHLCLPVEATEKTIIALPITKKVIERKEGDLLWPDREGPQEIAQAKIRLGSYGYAGQYQQRPSPAEGGIFKRVWWRYWHFPEHPLPPVPVKTKDGIVYIEALPLPEQLDEIMQSWDMAFKDKKTSAFVSGQVWGRRGANRYFLDHHREKLDFVGTIKAVKILTEKWPRATAKLVEDAANGPAVMSTLKNEIPGLIAVQPMGSKESRAHAVSPMVEAGNVFLPHPGIYPWVNDFVEETVTFPNSLYKDQVDAMTQVLNRMAGEKPFDQEAVKLLKAVRIYG